TRHHHGQERQRRRPARGRRCRRRPRGHRAALHQAASAHEGPHRWLHPSPQDWSAPGRRRPHGAGRAGRSVNIKLIVEYEGTHYHGWQAQTGRPTVEAALHDAIQSLTGEAPRLAAAGRTDAGVHALGQVVNFNLAQPFPVAELPGALNARLAPDISVRHAELVDDAFDARYSARARLYAYRIRQALPRGAYQRQYAWGLRDRLDELLNGSTVGLRLAPPQGLVQVAVEY